MHMHVSRSCPDYANLRSGQHLVVALDANRYEGGLNVQQVLGHRPGRVWLAKPAELVRHPVCYPRDVVKSSGLEGRFGVEQGNLF